MGALVIDLISQNQECVGNIRLVNQRKKKIELLFILIIINRTLLSSQREKNTELLEILFITSFLKLRTLFNFSKVDFIFIIIVTFIYLSDLWV